MAVLTRVQQAHTESGTTSSHITTFLTTLTTTAHTIHPYLPTITLIAITTLFRYMFSLFGHSGEATPPMYGDYEAQRHWLEITYNLPPTQWYRHSPNNNLQYWGLDYPPLTAYHSYILAYVADRLGYGELIALHTSHGHESLTSKLFMRTTVIISELLTCIPATVLIYKRYYQDQHQLSMYVACMNFSLMLVDHVHFQYNSVCFGFILYSIYYILQADTPQQHTSQHQQPQYSALSMRCQVMCSVMYVCAICFKQIALYYSLPYFTFLLAINYHQHKHAPAVFLRNIAILGVTVITTFALIALPWLGSLDDIRSVLIRVFPFQRGIYEDKSANMWSVLSIIYKFHLRIQQQTMLRLSTVCTLISLAYAQWCTLKRPTVTNMLYNLVISSLSFYMWSYQVHEKTILFVLCPLLVLMPKYTVLCLYAMMVANFSMFPLLVRDGAAIPYIVSQVLLLCIAADIQKRPHEQAVYKAFQLSSIVMVAVHVAREVLPVLIPAVLKRYPDLVTYSFTIMSGMHCVALLLCMYAEMYKYNAELSIARRTVKID